jgi:HEAT repeat protein
MFRVLATTYIVAGLERGVPSLFVDIKSLYENSDKMAVVGELVEDVVTKLEAETSLHGDGTLCYFSANTERIDTTPPPTTLLWAYYFLALHLAHPRHPSPDHIRALELLDKAIEHTPTLPELYMARAMVLKRAGDATSAAREMELARALDGQDRYVNGKAGKYLMRAGQGDKAIEVLGLFTKVSQIQRAVSWADEM